MKGDTSASMRDRARAQRDRDAERTRVCEDLLEFANGDQHIDLDELADAWLAAIRPRWRRALHEAGGRRRRNRLRRIAGLVPELEREPIDDAKLGAVLECVRDAKPLAERVVAAIVGVPPRA